MLQHVWGYPPWYPTLECRSSTTPWIPGPGISVPNDGSAQTAHCSCYGKRPGAMEVYDVEVLGYWDWDTPLNDDRRQTLQWRNAENLPCVDGVIWDPRQWLHTALQHS